MVAKKLLPLFCLFVSITLHAQGYNAEKNQFANFIVRYWKTNPFEGIKIVTDYHHMFLVSAVSLDASKYANESILNRVACAKAMAEANRYLNGSLIDTELIVPITGNNDKGNSEILQTIHERSRGYVKQLEHLSNFQSTSGRTIFLFVTELPSE